MESQFLEFLKKFISKAQFFQHLAIKPVVSILLSLAFF